ncbi:MAG TPA: carboxymuconolactone decarboxylase family protein [Trebonia sp.]|nr:carboxymuconolactone decarboxylase family protein [Trebonia sp.]
MPASHPTSTDHPVFTEFTIESAPAASRRHLEATEKHLGYLPAASARWAASPHLLEGFSRLTGLFESATLDPLAREVVVMTMATRNGCHVCVAMHSGRLSALRADPALIAALRDGPHSPLADPALDAVRRFTLQLLDTAGDVGDDDLSAFLAAGYTPRNALEVVLGISTYTLSTFANRLTRAPVDGALRQFA